LYTDDSTTLAKVPAAKAWLQNFRRKNSCNEVKGGKHPWWRLHRPRNPDIFASPKFIGITTSKRIELVYDAEDGLYVSDAMYVFQIRRGIDPYFVAAILQSKLFLALYLISNQGEGRVIPQVKAAKLYPLPVPKYHSTRDLHRKISDLSKGMMRLMASVNTKSQLDRSVIDRQAATLDQQIEEAVREAYQLSDEEEHLIGRYLSSLPDTKSKVRRSSSDALLPV
jgi:hypothetical protein